MIVKKIRLAHFRNYKELTLEFDEQLNIIIGKNAQGKTNLLESLVLLSTTRSHRLKNDQDMIEHHEEFSVIECIVQSTFNKHLKIVLNSKGKILYNANNKIARSSDFIGLLNAVIFSPNDLEIFVASPKIRRRLIDLEIGKLSISYMNALNQYYKLMKNRNSLLKKGISDITHYEVIENQMIIHQKKIIGYRHEFIQQLNQYLKYYFNLLSEKEDQLEMNYLCCLDDLNNIEVQMKEKYSKYQRQDLMMKSTVFGIHREDIEFKLNGHLVHEYASQGQRRMIVLALKLALVKYIQDMKKDSPILLLDDVLSELDLEHQQLLFKIIPKNTQTIITTTFIDPRIKLGPHCLIKIDSGKMIKESI
ncbi:MAG: DNA replication/repair protein RecF [Erysipelotrichaceae bacterium]